MAIDKINGDYKNLISQISAMYAQAQENAVSAVNRCATKTSWQIGQSILEFEQGDQVNAQHGKTLLETLSTDLTALHGNFFSRSNLSHMRRMYGMNPIGKESPHNIREPYILEFLQIPEPYHLTETELEDRLISKLQEFLLELGKGFAFIGRQYRITLSNRHFYVDLVFYHRILKCFVLIDLKKEEAGYEDVGQMNMYLGYFANEENTEGDNPPVGIVLVREKDELLVKYAMHNISSQLFVSKYQLYLPNREELRALLERQLSRPEDE